MATLPAPTPFDALAHILRSAAALGPDAWDARTGGQAGKPAGDLPHLCDDLHALFKMLHDRGIPYLLVGGVALLKYVEGRNTEDIDLVLSVSSLAALPEIAIEERDPDFARGRFRGVGVDLLLTTNPVFKRVQERYATTHRFGEFTVPCATVEGLVLLKLYALPDLDAAGRLQRALLYESDIAMLCQKHRPDMKQLLNVLKQYVQPGPFEELTKIAEEIAAKIARLNKRGV